VAGGERGELRVGYAPFLTIEIVPSVLRIFQEAHPAVQVKLCDLSTQEMVQGLDERRLDLALLVGVSMKLLPECEFVELRRYGVCVAVPPTHRLAGVRKIGVPRLAAERLIAFSRDEYPEYHSWLNSLFSRAGHLPEIAEEHDSATSLMAAVEAGSGVALVLEPFKCFVGSRVKLVPFSAPPVVVGAAFRKSPTASRHVESFLAVAKRVSERDAPCESKTGDDFTGQPVS
jgi:DNA-binding transcriptional LysR family regulator